MALMPAAMAGKIGTLEEVRALMPTVADFPKKGIQFLDVTPVLFTPHALGVVTAALVARLPEGATHVAGVEARGWPFAAALAERLGVGFIPVRKPGKLPADTIGESYSLEYGDARLEIHRDAVEPDQRVVVIDDLLATGGTAAAAGRLLSRLGARVQGYGFMVELAFLKGREELEADSVFSLIRYA